MYTYGDEDMKPTQQQESNIFLHHTLWKPRVHREWVTHHDYV